MLAMTVLFLAPSYPIFAAMVAYPSLATAVLAVTAMVVATLTATSVTTTRPAHAAAADPVTWPIDTWGTPQPTDDAVLKWDEQLPWSDPDNDEPHLVFDPDPIRYVLSKPIAVTPDTVWVYNGGGTELLGNIIERTSGMPLEAFAREFFFNPLGITDFDRDSEGKFGRPEVPADQAKCPAWSLRPLHRQFSASDTFILLA